MDSSHTENTALTQARVSQSADEDDFDARFRSNTGFLNYDNILAHFRFYNAVRALIASKGSDISSNPNAEQLLLIARSVARFETWQDKVLQQRTSAEDLKAKELPPIDVLLVLHAYMLSPHHLRQDGFAYKGLHQVGKFPLELLATEAGRELLDDNGDYHPSDDQKKAWKDKTGLNWDINATLSDPTIICPSCGKETSVCWVSGNEANVDGTGYGEAKFNRPCAECKASVTYDKLGIKKLIADLSTNADHLQETYIARAVAVAVDPESDNIKNLKDTLKEIVDDIKASVKRKLNVSDQDLCEELLKKDVKWVQETLTNDKHCKLNKQRLNVLLDAYTSPSSFSVDLRYKVYQQAIMTNLCLKARYLDVSKVTTDQMNKMIRSYHDFLKNNSDRPILDADLIWHTHQLVGDDYRTQIKAITNTYLDHRPEGSKASYSGTDGIYPKLGENDSAPEAFTCGKSATLSLAGFVNS